MFQLFLGYFWVQRLLLWHLMAQTFPVAFHSWADDYNTPTNQGGCVQHLPKCRGLLKPVLDSECAEVPVTSPGLAVGPHVPGQTGC